MALARACMGAQLRGGSRPPPDWMLEKAERGLHTLAPLQRKFSPGPGPALRVAAAARHAVTGKAESGFRCGRGESNPRMIGAFSLS